MKLFLLSALLLGAVTHVHAGAKGSAAPAPSEAAIMKKLNDLEEKIAEIAHQVRALYESSRRRALAEAEAMSR
jgi:hypothetical protein